MTAQEAVKNLKHLFSEYELDLPCTDSLETLNTAISALEKQIKLKIWIENYKKKDTLLFDKNNVISLLEEFRLE